MTRLKKSDDFQPVAWVGQYPIHVTTLLVIINAATMIATSILMSLGHQAFLNQLAFSSEAVRNDFAIWQFFTYPFVNPPSIGFVISMFLLFSFGREVERFVGRSAFLWLYLVLLLVPPCLLSAVGFFHPTGLVGASVLNFSVFLAFAILYPNVEFFLIQIAMKYIAWVMLSIYTLQALAYRDWTSLVVLWASAITAYIYTARLRSVPIFGGLELHRPRTKAAAVSAAPVKPRRPRESDVVESIDPLLEKISQHGLKSLTMRERERLEQARTTLLRKTR
ncbi:MAG: rhomboid family intramembrane serine protease [Verrucomicrobiota bacterium]|nr:rhomboid family intramembrane serine protease [Verrucomicrobiota bacterium]